MPEAETEGMAGSKVSPAVHDHEVGLDVAGCRGCYLEGSRWPWPGGSDPVQEKRIRALEAEVARLKALINHARRFDAPRHGPPCPILEEAVE